MTVVLVDPRRPSLVPVEAVELLAGDVQYTEEMPIKVPWSLPSARPVLHRRGRPGAAVLGSRASRGAGPAGGGRATDLRAGARSPASGWSTRWRSWTSCAPPGRGKASRPTTRCAAICWRRPTSCSTRCAAATPTSCARNSEMCCCRCCFTPGSPRRRSAQPFGIDDVADALVRKLGNRVPAVLAGESISLEEQLAQWERAQGSGEGARARPAWTTCRPRSPRWRWRRR